MAYETTIAELLAADEKAKVCLTYTPHELYRPLKPSITPYQTLVIRLKAGLVADWYWVY
jgi:hypothetical protein